MQKGYLPLFFSTLISSMYISPSKAASGGGMLIELAANERAVHGDFFNSKNFMPVVYPSFSMMMKHLPPIPSSTLYLFEAVLTNPPNLFPGFLFEEKGWRKRVKPRFKTDYYQLTS